jgi:hypothetical protein
MSILVRWVLFDDDSGWHLDIARGFGKCEWALGGKHPIYISNDETPPSASICPACREKYTRMIVEET